MKKVTKTSKLIKKAVKNGGITRIDILKMGFSSGYSRTLEKYFKVQGKKEIKGRKYLNYVVK